MQTPTSYCYSCDEAVTGKYCSNCGHEHSEDMKSHWLYYLKLYTRIGELIKTLRTFLFILRSPVKNMVHLYRTSSLDAAIQFAIVSITFASLLKITVGVTEGVPIYSEIYELVFFFIIYAFFMASSYFTLRYQNPYTFSPKNFIKMVSYLEGFLFLIAIFGIALALGTPLKFLVGTAALISVPYRFVIWRSFAQLTTASILWRTIIALPLQGIGMGMLIYWVLTPLAGLLGLKLL